MTHSPEALRPGSAVHVHVHLAVAGSFPLRACDLLFADDRLHIVEHAYLTPLFGLARGRLPDAGDRARERYREDGPAGLFELAERTHVVHYESIERVRTYDSRLARPKLAVDMSNGPPYGYRIHAPVDVEALSAALESLGDRRGFAVESRSGVGYSPGNSVRRFLAGR
ncbi:hypothetical protein [Halapricum hydrolyticum]|uniref:Uncharacterized protein n=1 Tax=Halapricum hydrolyticum TaxID=2979991 RepID=A0AAE3I905_9EURY|nr:hypothetical protein [Halapricum hydrolyticum]MCU4717113.1 hypothetical protein [Halapricum hydrolyticum]MCU4726040.1 hypothetical protein [Halapricum hydrolyticum]